MKPSTRLSTYLGLERLAEAADGQPSPDLRTRLDAAWDALTAVEVAWLRARRPVDSENHFQDAARGRKVLKLLESVPVGTSQTENQIIAEWLESMSGLERGTFAEMAKCNVPSDETWRQLIDAIRARKTVDDLTREILK